MEKRTINTTSVLLASLLSLGIASAHSQTSGTGTTEKALVPASALSRYTTTYNVKVIQSDSPAPAFSVDSAPATGRVRSLQRLAAANNVTWHKVYFVTPARPGLPVTTLAQARQMADQKGSASLSLGTVPAFSAMKSVAQADNATMQFQGAGTMGAIRFDLDNVPVAQAIARIAERTHTNWQAEYVISPIAGSQVSPANIGVGPQTGLTAQQNEATNMFNGPITIHVSSSNVNPAPGAVANKPVAMGSGVSNVPSVPTAQPGAIAASNSPFGGGYPAYNSDYPYNVTTGTYSNGVSNITSPAVSLPPGIVEQNLGYNPYGYNPYMGPPLVISGGTVNAF